MLAVPEHTTTNHPNSTAVHRNFPYCPQNSFVPVVGRRHSRTTRVPPRGPLVHTGIALKRPLRRVRGSYSPLPAAHCGRWPFRNHHDTLLDRTLPESSSAQTRSACPWDDRIHLWATPTTDTSVSDRTGQTKIPVPIVRVGTRRTDTDKSVSVQRFRRAPLVDLRVLTTETGRTKNYYWLSAHTSGKPPCDHPASNRKFGVPCCSS